MPALCVSTDRISQLKRRQTPKSSEIMSIKMRLCECKEGNLSVCSSDRVLMNPMPPRPFALAAESISKWMTEEKHHAGLIHLDRCKWHGQQTVNKIQTVWPALSSLSKSFVWLPTQFSWLAARLSADRSRLVSAEHAQHNAKLVRLCHCSFNIVCKGVWIETHSIESCTMGQYNLQIFTENKLSPFARFTASEWSGRLIR